MFESVKHIISTIGGREVVGYVTYWCSDNKRCLID